MTGQYSPAGGCKDKLPESFVGEPNRSRFAIWLHRASGVVLIGYFLSHFGFLTVREPTNADYNTVFPFLTNWWLYLIVGMFELVLAIACFRAAGYGYVNWVIWGFIGALLWYRWAFYYTGGSYCNCTGLFGRMMHLNKIQARVIPLITMGFLGITTLPGVWKFSRSCMSRRLTLLAALLSYTLSGNAKDLSDQTVTIEGSIDLQEYNGHSGKPYPDQKSQGTFSAVLSGAAWKLMVINTTRPAWWSEMVYDGTNSYTLQPQGGQWYTTNLPEQRAMVSTIEPSPRFLPALPDQMGLYMLWLTYGLPPKVVTTNKTGLVEIPLPSGHPRDNPNSYGFKWLISRTEDGRFVSNCDVIRDQQLDLAEKDEFFRPELDYPETLGDFNDYLKNLRYRGNLPTGFLKYHYECLKWYETNGLMVPLETELKVYLNQNMNAYPYRIVKIKASSIVVRDGTEGLLPSITAIMHVADYRYKARNKARIFKYAEYTLQPGEDWKTDNDPKLLKQETDWLNNGRRYTDFSGKHKNVMAWVLLATITGGPLFMIIALRRNKAAQQKQHKMEKTRNI